MKRYFRVDENFVATMLVLNSELGYIIDEGLDSDPGSIDTIERCNNTLAALIEKLDG